MKLHDLKERVATDPDYTPEERSVLLAALMAANDTQPTEVHDPGNYLTRIEHIWAFLSVDAGGEGVVAAPMGRITAPLIAADERRLADLRPLVQKLIKVFNKPIRLAKFTAREDIEIFRPSPIL